MNATGKFSSSLLQQIWRCAERPQTPVSLKQMCQFGQRPNPGELFKASCFLLEELQVRLAHRITEMDEFPSGLNKMEDVLRVRNWYIKSFQDLQEFAGSVDTREGRLYQMLYAGRKPEVIEREPLARILELLYRDDELQEAPYADDGRAAACGLVRPPAQYYSQLPEDLVMTGHADREAFYKIWPQEILLFNDSYYKMLKRIKVRHDATVVTLARGLLRWKRTQKNNVVDASIKGYLDRFYMGRIGIRMLIGQHLSLLEQAMHSDLACEHVPGAVGSDADYVGIVCTRTKVAQVADIAIDRARHICAEYYNLYEAPKVELHTIPIKRDDSSGLREIEFTYVPSHLVHMLFEVLKNALRATVESTIQKNPGVTDYDSLRFPPVKVIISEGTEELAVKISDEGGGIARSNLPLVWTYLYTTMTDDEQDSLIDGDSTLSGSCPPMAGYGYGLALSRLYARHFGGDLRLLSMDGYGTDVYLHLNRLESCKECLT
ncbi:AER270Wp [Eremothecium gossypii ATCC 10895]|uniref:Protein-serine/threonine kinase n=1 Tax=Eremothecium gossypii (strain ATCC 10895 / CBS 109.51 / FGSC 9923 / NRRL Y-1056) TaxID=284811 RepID=Q756J1_EREGS|nr:AER270Wp [Eremothecium gossypii ATCC 10895]AAS52951.2 AER270Wp [Eremothecium gossypii ATCC 10895]AEY97258.1 FAER270Wp [Eremothecium gossypii FDAG1]